MLKIGKTIKKHYNSKTNKENLINTDKTIKFYNVKQAFPKPESLVKKFSRFN